MKDVLLSWHASEYELVITLSLSVQINSMVEILLFLISKPHLFRTIEILRNIHQIKFSGQPELFYLRSFSFPFGPQSSYFPVLLAGIGLDFCVCLFACNQDHLANADTTFSFYISLFPFSSEYINFYYICCKSCSSSPSSQY